MGLPQFPVKCLLLADLFHKKNIQESLSSLPGKDQLISMLMSTMTAPVRNLMYAMNGVMEKLVRTLKAVEEKKQEE